MPDQEKNESRGDEEIPGNVLRETSDTERNVEGETMKGVARRDIRNDREPQERLRK